MTIRKCDKCGKTEDSVIMSGRFVIEYDYIQIYDEYGDEKIDEKRRKKEKFDLCSSCASEVYKNITGHLPYKEIL